MKAIVGSWGTGPYRLLAEAAALRARVAELEAELAEARAEAAELREALSEIPKREVVLTSS